MPGLFDGQWAKTLDVLHSVDGWPTDDEKDVALLERLADLYPKVDLYEEAVGWAAWMSEYTSRKEVKHRARFRNWVRKASEYRARAGKVRGYRSAEAEGHGRAGEARKKW